MRPQVWGDGEPEGVRQRAAEEMKLTARLAQRLGSRRWWASPSRRPEDVATFPPWRQRTRLATRTSPTAGTRPDVPTSAACGRARDPPAEIAYDYWTTVRALEAVDCRAGVRVELVPEPHDVGQHIDPVAYITDFADRIYHVDCKDTRTAPGRRRNGVLSSQLAGRPAPRLGLRPAGRGDVPGEDASDAALIGTTAASRSSGRTPAWTASAAPPRPGVPPRPGPPNRPRRPSTPCSPSRASRAGVHPCSPDADRSLPALPSVRARPYARTSYPLPLIELPTRRPRARQAEPGDLRAEVRQRLRARGAERVGNDYFPDVAAAALSRRWVLGAGARPAGAHPSRRRRGAAASHGRARGGLAFDAISAGAGAPTRSPCRRIRWAP